MSYTVAHRQEGVTRANIAGLIRHEYRDVDKSNGVETQHSNERIVPERTHLNESVIFVDGEHRSMSHSSEILDELDRRLAQTVSLVKDKKTGEIRQRELRKDAGVVRSVILQLDPEFTGSSERYLEDQEHQNVVRGHLVDMVDFVGDLYGRHNLLAMTIHVDEKSPHVHLLVTPIDDEGRIRQKSFIKDNKHLSRVNKDLRKHLIEQGFDADREARGVRKTHMTIDEYARHAQALEKLEKDRQALVEREKALEAREQRFKADMSEKIQRLAEIDAQVHASVEQIDLGTKFKEFVPSLPIEFIRSIGRQEDFKTFAEGRIREWRQANSRAGRGPLTQEEVAFRVFRETRQQVKSRVGPARAPGAPQPRTGGGLERGR